MVAAVAVAVALSGAAARADDADEVVRLRARVEAQRREIDALREEVAGLAKRLGALEKKGAEAAKAPPAKETPQARLEAQLRRILPRELVFVGSQWPVDPTGPIVAMRKNLPPGLAELVKDDVHTFGRIELSSRGADGEKIQIGALLGDVPPEIPQALIAPFAAAVYVEGATLLVHATRGGAPLKVLLDALGSEGRVVLAGPEFVVTGLVRGEGGAFHAIINGATVHGGEPVPDRAGKPTGARLISIDTAANTVLLERDGKRFTIEYRPR